MIYLILLAYLIVGYFYPAIGLIAIICMIGPVALSIFRGRYWCGHICPRGNLYDRLISRISRHKPIPHALRSQPFRIFMVTFIFTMFGLRLSHAWGSWNAVGHVFWLIILITTIVGIILSVIYSPRTWCSFCPMGTMSAWVAPKHPKPHFKNIHISAECQTKCKLCAKACPMQLTPYTSRGQASGYMHPDCIKCQKCVNACPLKITHMK
jgi:ferredoxin-type protein NapH